VGGAGGTAQGDGTPGSNGADGAAGAAGASGLLYAVLSQLQGVPSGQGSVNNYGSVVAGIFSLPAQISVTGATLRSLYLKDDTGSNMVELRLNETLTSHRTLLVSTGDANRSLTLTGDASIAGSVTVTSGKTLTATNTLTLAGTDGTTMTFPPASASVGYLNIPQNSQSAAYELVLADSGKHILHPSADVTARTFTIPANSSVAFAVGTAITFVNQNAGGVVTIAITTDTMRLAGAGTTGSRTLAANGVATAIKITSTEWIISGTGLT
jgi:hypothetical protein